MSAGTIKIQPHPLWALSSLLGVGIVSGLAVGALTGLLEILALSAITKGTAIHFLLPAMGFYGALWAALAVGLGLGRVAALLALRKPLMTGGPLTRWNLSVLIPLAVFVVAGGHINMRWLPAWTDWRSLAFDGVFLLANIWFGVWLYRHGVGWVSRAVRQQARRLSVLLATALALGLVAGAWSLWARRQAVQDAQLAAAPGAPNVLLIALDAVRPDHLSVHGYPRRTSPNLERLAQEGVVFTKAFANSSWTKTSVATIFTSLYPSSHSATHLAAGVPSDLLTLPEALQSRGYATGIFSANPFVSPHFGFGQGVDRFRHKQVSVFKQVILGQILRKFRKFSSTISKLYEGRVEPAPELRDEFLQWIATVNDRPFFAYFHFMEAHTPHTAPAPFNRLFTTNAAPAEQLAQPVFTGLHPFSRVDPLPPEEFDALIAQYDAAIAYQDHVLGELVEALRQRGLDDRTVVIVTADHGEELYDHEGWGHGKSLYREVTHVPLIIRYPKAVPAGRVVARVAQHIDLMPTILDLCGIPLATFMEGRSLVPIVNGSEEGTADTTPIYSELVHVGEAYARAIQLGRFKLVRANLHAEEAWLLFDVEADPHEQHPLDADSHPMGQELRELLASFQARTGEAAVAATDVHLDEEMREHLHALGYLH